MKSELESENNGVLVQVDAKVEKIAKIRMCLRIENNNKFVRGKGKVRKSIEQYLTYYYKMEVIANEYIIYVPYTTVEELKKAVYDILGELDREADMRNCFIEADTYCDELGLTW